MRIILRMVSSHFSTRVKSDLQQKQQKLCLLGQLSVRTIAHKDAIVSEHGLGRVAGDLRQVNQVLFGQSV